MTGRSAYQIVEPLVPMQALGFAEFIGYDDDCNSSAS